MIVVDDEEGLRTTLSAFLKAEGNEVETAADYTEAVTAFEAGSFDLVMTDIILPGKTGIEILAYVREQDPDCPVVMITGEPSFETATEAIRLGAFDYLAKPVRGDQVTRVARQALAQRAILLDIRRLERENREHQEHLEERVEEQTREVRTLAEELAVLAEIGRVITSSADIREVFDQFAILTSKLISFDRLVITTHDAEAETLTDRYVTGVKVQGWFEGNTHPLSATVVEAVVLKQIPFIATGLDESEAPDHPLEKASREAGLMSMLAVPLVSRDRVMGTLNLKSRTPGAYVDADVALVRQVADQIAGAIANSRLMAELEVRAHTDLVTGLSNRSSFEMSIDSRIASGEESAAAMLVIEIDRMRELEQRFGVEFASSLIRAIGERLVSEFPDGFLTGRIGQDELGICVFGRDAAMRWTETANEIVATCTRPFEIEGELIGLDVALGVALFPGHARSGEDLTRKAVLALRSGGQTYEATTLFAPDMEESTSDHVRILTAVRQGMENNELLLHYQPKIDLATGRIVGAEALARWDSAERGMVSPGDFMPVLEDSGYMWEFTGWTIAEAVEQIQRWSDLSMLHDEEPFSLAVNVSARDFQDSRLPERIKANLELWGVQPEMLEIEVTETAVMEAPEAAVQVCRELKEMGLSVAIDDFGVGQSPLAYLDRLDVDVIKIDRAFVMNVDQSETSKSIIQAIIGLGTQLGKKVVAEGVETEAEFRVLQELGCHQGQGYFWARPMPEVEFRKLLRDGLSAG